MFALFFTSDCAYLTYRWTDEELSSLPWIYMQCNSSLDMFGEIIKMFKEDGIIKTRESVVAELYRQNLINKEKYESEKSENSKKIPETVQIYPKDSGRDEIGKLCEQFVRDGKSSCLIWLQKVLLETCFAKICHGKITEACIDPDMDTPLKKEIKMLNFELLKENDLAVPSPVSYHSLRK